MSPGLVVPLEPGSLAASASAELERQINALVPDGKRGAVMTVIDGNGVRIGLAATYKGTVTVSLEAHKGWDVSPPSAALKIKAVF